MSQRRDPDEDLADLLADLDRTLGDLRAELRDRERTGREQWDDRRDRRRSPRDRRGGPTARESERYGYRRTGGERDRDDRERPLPRPPSLGEMFRFTEEYTIPTVISVLETTIRSLELLRSVLRLADPERSVFDAADDRGRSTVERLGRSKLGREALSGVDRALDDLRDALSDVPPDDESRDIVTDARDLMGEIEARIEDAERQRERNRYGYREDRSETSADRRRDDRSNDRGGRDGRGSDRNDRRTDPVTIDVSDEDGDEMADDEETPQVDVDAELASIRKEVRGDDGEGEDAEDDEDAGSEESQSGGEETEDDGTH